MREEKQKEDTEKERCPGDTLPYSQLFSGLLTLGQLCPVYLCLCQLHTFSHLIYYFMYMNALPAYM